MEPLKKKAKLTRKIEGQDSYRYEQLLDKKRLIRKLELLPASSKSSPLAANLVIDELDEERYEAVSYTWGSDEKPCSIAIGSHTLAIGTNLDAALRGLRTSAGSRWLWADAICINQIDDTEKTRQVAMMARIYRHAQRTLSWVGPESTEHDGQATMEFFYWLSNTARVKQSLEKDGSMATLELVFKKYNAQISSPASHMTIKNLVQFCQRPYFTRRWILQEVGVASKVQFWCGASTIPGDVLAEVASCLLFKESPISITTPFMRFMSLRKPDKYHASAKKAAGPPVHDALSEDDDDLGMPTAEKGFRALGALERFREFECLDGRDRIASLAWIGNRGPMFSVSYRSSVEDVYIDFIANLPSECLVSALSSASRRQHNTSATLPSWVPDWRVPAKEYFLELRIASSNLNAGQSITLLRQRAESSFKTEIIKERKTLKLSLSDFQQNQAVVVSDAVSPLQRGDHVLQFSEDNSTRFDLAGAVRAVVLRRFQGKSNCWKVVAALDLQLNGRASSGIYASEILKIT